MTYQLGNKTIEISPFPDGWHVRRYIWPAAHEQGDPAFPSETEAVAAIEKSAGRTLKVIGPAVVHAEPDAPQQAQPVAVEAAPAPTPAPAEPTLSEGRIALMDSRRDLIGVVPDRDAARLIGVTAAVVASYRAVRGIPSPRGPGRPRRQVAPPAGAQVQPVAVAPSVVPATVAQPPSLDASSEPDRDGAATDAAVPISAEPALTAYTVIAENAVGQCRLLVIGSGMGEAVVRAEAALATRDAGPWKIVRADIKGEVLG